MIRRSAGNAQRVGEILASFQGANQEEEGRVPLGQVAGFLNQMQGSHCVPNVLMSGSMTVVLVTFTPADKMPVKPLGTYCNTADFYRLR